MTPSAEKAPRPAARSTAGSGARGGRAAARAAVRAVKPVLRERWRRALVRRGTDVTAATAGRSCLVLAPHYDDETLGAGATIVRKRDAGTPVRVVFATDGTTSHRSAVIAPEELGRIRADEALAACALLGVGEDDIVRLELPESQLSRHLDVLTQRLAEEIRAFRPDEIFVTSEFDWLADHQALNRAARQALGATGRQARLLEYPVWYWADGPWLQRPPGRGPARYARDFVRDFADGLQRHRPELVSTDGLLERKRAALSCYRSQITNLTGEADWATFPPGFLPAFQRPHEIFFPVVAAAARSAASPAGQRTKDRNVKDRA